ncbi:PBP1A family penicillin-binding protein [Candidatus Parcubacteria bacterium]|nr:PBP1A family penicillin-binding protein [Candidatus Parcubacteria bacterium]
MAVRRKYRIEKKIVVKKRPHQKKRSGFKLPKISHSKKVVRKGIIKKGTIRKKMIPTLFERVLRIKKNKSKKGRIKRFFKFALRLSIIFFVAGLVTMIGVFIYFSKDIPNPDRIADRSVAQSTKIYDRTGEHLLYEIHGEEKRSVVKLDQISQHLINATIATEDQKFYKHHGVDFKGIARAIYKDVISGEKLQGGSTITQQLIKNSVLTPERTLTRKIKELILAIETEQKFSKDEILEMYLNQIPYGSNAYGIESAAQTFFGKSAKDLDISESALLAGLPKATTYYSPYGAHPEAVENRYQNIIWQMEGEGFISEEEANIAKEEKILKRVRPFEASIKAPHFVMYIKQQLVDEYGVEKVEKGGLRVYTTLDYDMQLIAEDAVRKGVEKNTKQYNAKNASLVAIDPETGQILSMVGSKDYFNLEEDGNVNVAISNRQPGSSFKPFVYAAAFKKGYTPNTILFDVETNFGKDGSGKEYRPQNYNFQFSGPVTIREALGRSLNIPAVKTLYLAGIGDSVQMAHDLGITTMNSPDKYGLSLVLGTGEVKLIDMVSAYSVFANDGKRNNTVGILKIEDSYGEVLQEFTENPKNVLDQQVARNINSILSDNSARMKTFGMKNKLNFEERPVAAKTGTTSDYKDGWTIGYTPGLATGVWAGNNNGEKMKQGGGITVAAPIWNDFMSRVLALDPVENFIPPKPIETGKRILDGEFSNEIVIEIDKACVDKLATELTPEDQIDEKTYLEIHNILYYVDKDNPREDIPADPSSDLSFASWEETVLLWAQENETEMNTTLPAEVCSVRQEDKMPILQVRYPQDNQIVKNGKIVVSAESFTVFGMGQIDVYFDDNLIGVGKVTPYEVSYKLPSRTKEGLHTVSVRAYDKVGNLTQKEITVIVSNNSSLYLKPILETDFPFILNTAVSASNIRNVDFYYQLDSIYDADMNLVKKPGIKKKISSADYAVPGEENIYQILWEEDKQYFISGKYKIFAILNEKNGRSYESNKRFVEVK